MILYSLKAASHSNKSIEEVLLFLFLLSDVKISYIVSFSSIINVELLSIKVVLNELIISSIIVF